MRRVAHPYTDWEGWRAGMYALSDSPIEHVAAAHRLLTDPPALGEAMRKAVDAWPVETEHWLSRPGANSRAYLGGAACMITAGAPILCTRAAWWKLSPGQMAAANREADEVRDAWIAARGVQSA